jgi:hypothetical protein
MRVGVPAEMALRERDRAHRGDAMRTHGTASGGGNEHDGNEGTDQDDSK